jgi:hypothetical protein
MRSGLTYLIRALGSCAAAAALAAAPVAGADPQPPPPAPPTVTVTVTAPAPGPQDNQACTSSVSSTKCVKPGDAEINSGIPAPYPGPFGVYGPYFAG